MRRPAPPMRRPAPPYEAAHEEKATYAGEASFTTEASTEEATNPADDEEAYTERASDDKTARDSAKEARLGRVFGFDKAVVAPSSKHGGGR